MLEIPICCTVCCSPWELQWWVIGAGISQKPFQSLPEIGQDWNYHSLFLKKGKGEGWERQQQYFEINSLSSSAFHKTTSKATGINSAASTQGLTLLELQINLHYCGITLSMQVSYWPIISHFLHSLPPELPTVFSPVQIENRINTCCRNQRAICLILLTEVWLMQGKLSPHLQQNILMWAEVSVSG